MEQIPKGKLCDSGCNQPAKFFSNHTGRYRCNESANRCPSNRTKNSEGLKKAHKDGKIPSFSNEHRNRSHISHRKKLVESKPFEELGHRLRKKIVLEEQEYKCNHCELDQWMGLKITLELDHIDGNRTNNFRENLRCLCPNCHSLTETWKKGQTGKRKCSDEEIIQAWNESKNMNQTLTKLGYNWGSIDTVKKVLNQYNLLSERSPIGRRHQI